MERGTMLGSGASALSSSPRRRARLWLLLTSSEGWRSQVDRIAAHLDRLDRLLLRLLQRVCWRHLVGGNRLDRAVDLVADLREHGNRAIAHVGTVAHLLEHLEIKGGDILTIQRQ